MKFFILLLIFAFLGCENGENSENSANLPTQNAENLTNSATQNAENTTNSAAQNEKFAQNAKNLENPTNSTKFTKQNLTQNSSQNSTQTKIFRVFASVSPTTTLLEVLYPEGIIGLNHKPNPQDLAFLPERIATLPALGSFNTMNFEHLVALKPDLIIFSAPPHLKKFTQSAFTEPFEKLGIKTLIVGFGFEDFENSVKAISSALSVQERGQRLLDFYQRQAARLENLRKKVAKKPRIYFAYGVEGLQTHCASEDEVDLAELIGGQNAVKCEQIFVAKDSQPLNFEQILLLNPEAIFASEKSLYVELTSRPSEQWGRVAAVKNKRVFYVPESPSNWLVRPPTMMRIVGYSWAFSKLHPDLMSEAEAKKIAQEFFAQFLRPLSDEDYERLEGKR